MRLNKGDSHERDATYPHDCTRALGLVIRAGEDGAVGGWPPPDPTSQLLGSARASPWSTGLTTCSAMVDQSTSLMRPMSAPDGAGRPVAPRPGAAMARLGARPRRSTRAHVARLWLRASPWEWRDPGGTGLRLWWASRWSRAPQAQSTMTVTTTTTAPFRARAAAARNIVSPAVAAGEWPGTRLRLWTVRRTTVTALCCVEGADLVVETRLGERRVVTLEVVNERRRERDITLDLGPFTTRGGSPAPVVGAVDGERPSNWRRVQSTW